MPARLSQRVSMPSCSISLFASFGREGHSRKASARRHANYGSHWDPRITGLIVASPIAVFTIVWITDPEVATPVYSPNYGR